MKCVAPFLLPKGVCAFTWYSLMVMSFPTTVLKMDLITGCDIMSMRSSPVDHVINVLSSKALTVIYKC